VRLADVFFACAPDGLVGDGVDDLQPDDLVSEQTKTPAGLPVGRRRTRERDEVGVLPPVQRSVVDAVRLFALQRREQSVGDERPADALNGAGMQVERLGEAASDQAGPPSPWSALSRIRARLSVRAEAMPEPTSVRSSARCFSVRTTQYEVTIAGLQWQSGGTLSSSRRRLATATLRVTHH